MTHETNDSHENSGPRDAGDATQLERDVLIARVVDGEAGVRDWQALKDLAASDQSVWAELAETQRAQDELTRAVERATAPAMAVELPEIEPARSHAGTPGVNVTQRRLDIVAKFGGWAAAAAIVLVGYLGLRLPGMEQGHTGTNTAGLVPVMSTPEEAFNQYLVARDAEGSRYVGEMPGLIVKQTLPLESGGADVYYIRQIVERRRVAEVFERTLDEFGNVVETPAQVRGPASAF